MIIFTTRYSKSYQTGTSLSLKIAPGRLYELVFNNNNNNLIIIIIIIIIIFVYFHHSQISLNYR